MQVRGGDATVRVDPRGTDPRRAPPVRVDVRHPASGGGSGVVVRGRGPSVVVEQPPTLIAHGETYVDYGVDVVEHQDWASAQFDEQFDEPGVEIIEHGSATYVDGQVILEPMGHAEHANELVVGVPAEVVEVAPETPFRMRAHLGLNLGYTIQGAVRGSIDARISFPRGFELDLGYAGYLAEGYAGQPDALGLGRFALSYRMGSDAFYVRLGSGLRRFRDVEGALTGVDAGAGLGVLGERVSFTVDGTAGVIGRAYILGTRIELGIQLQPWVQLVVGLDHVSLISRDLGGGGAALTTPSIGIRLTTR
ncbi:MAG: hypothetical protein KF901_02655 [Myxococcales bacterium]|nr:hypothetical protein [Myxococcales bacterium]